MCGKDWFRVRNLSILETKRIPHIPYCIGFLFQDLFQGFNTHSVLRNIWLNCPCNCALTTGNMLNDCEKPFFNLVCWHSTKAVFQCRTHVSFYPEMSKLYFEICISFLYWCLKCWMEFIPAELFVNVCMCILRYSHAFE